MSNNETKSPGMVRALDGLSNKMFKRVRSTSIEEGMCVTCGGVADTFKDVLSRKEYAISGMCQKCQDEVFAEPEDAGDIDNDADYDPRDDKGNDFNDGFDDEIGD